MKRLRILVAQLAETTLAAIQVGRSHPGAVPGRSRCA
jgi:hypothetical protein